MPVRMLQRAMTSSDFTEMVAFSLEEPFGSAIDDWRMNMLLAPHKKQGAPMISAADLFKETAEQTDEDQIAALKAFNNGL